MIDSGNIGSEVMGELFKTIECITVDGTLTALRNAQKSSLILNDAKVEFILKCVSNVTSVRREVILNGTDRNDDRKIAICLSMYFIKTYTSLKLNEDLKKVFGKDVSLISRNLKIVKEIPAKPKTDFDKTMASHFKEIEKLINKENGRK